MKKNILFKEKKSCVFLPKRPSINISEFWNAVKLLRPRIVKQRLNIFLLKKITKCFFKSNNSTPYKLSTSHTKKVHLKKKSNYHQ